MRFAMTGLCSCELYIPPAACRSGTLEDAVIGMVIGIFKGTNI